MTKQFINKKLKIYLRRKYQIKKVKAFALSKYEDVVLSDKHSK